MALCLPFLLGTDACTRDYEFAAQASTASPSASASTSTTPSTSATPDTLTVEFNQTTRSVTEGSNKSVRITLSEAADTDVTVDFVVSGTAGSADYTLNHSSSVTISAGDLQSDQITLTATSDTESESSETVILTISDSTSYTIGDNSTATFTISDATSTSSLALRRAVRDALKEAEGLNKSETVSRKSVGDSQSSESESGNWLGNLYQDEEIPGVAKDSDGDGFIDQYELDFGTSPDDALDMPPAPGSNLRDRFQGIDNDLDGITDDEEKEIGTNPFNSDTDSDGIKDGIETASDSNPLDAKSKPADRDGDGLSTEFENINGSDPDNPDTDYDGLSDSNELIFGTSPFDNDTDKDGILDGKEVELGADPLIAG